ncbi:ankyrin repeat-containing domain protein [Mycena albidolilacea]|uniref:Ankyrin repeat-containing domain protein n=1 Tax=Mycena albidolilacea TaxID=1033008 RepID=A0AAD7EC64_9AGAR|nr:ankyrin repeat-containing domain protein [Mycena albidolilacea]
MSQQYSESYTVNVQGGIGGQGGQGGQQGGGGGVGEGPRLNIGTATVHIQGGAEINIWDRDIIISWLSPINFFLQQADISQMRVQGTGGWLLEHPLFQKWESGSGSTLWCRGIPSRLTKLKFPAGAGKTVLVSMVVDHLGAVFRNNKDIGVACIYLNHKEADQQPPPKLLAENLYKQHREKGTVPSLEEVVNVLSSSLKEFLQVFIIVDAIDEYPELQREILLQQLAVMGSNVNLMITSRPNISPKPSSLPNLKTLDIQAAQEDIKAYINAQIKLSPRLSKHIQKKPITDTVAGMFLLARLHIESLREEATIKAVQEALKHLPEGLKATYDSAMTRIEDQGNKNKQIGYSTLTWVLNAKRPLTVSEIQTALAVEPDSQELDEDNVMDIETILAVCAGLVIVDKESSVLRLVHYTTQEYLDSIQAQKFLDAQIKITHTLLTFLNFDGYPDSSWTTVETEDLPPLVEYSQYCLAHAAAARQSEVQLRKVLLEFLEGAFLWRKTLGRREYSWEWQWNSMPWNYSDWPSQPSVLWVSAAANLVDTVKFLLDQAPPQPPLEHLEIIVASYYGHAEIVSFLLEKGANVNAAGGRYGSSLQAAAAQGHTEIVGVRLEKGADVNAAGGFYGSSLYAAAARGHIETVSILLEKGANINVAGGRHGSLLQIAAAQGHTDFVSILLEKGVNINAAGGRDGSSLQIAADRGHTEIVSILLEKGADVNAVGGRYESSLQIAAAGGYTEIVSILLEKGANINAVGGRYESSLQIAAARGHTEIVSILLEKGANINAAGGRDGSSLQIAAARGATEIVGILLERIAAARGYTEIVSILLEKGADVNAAGGEDGTSLQIAVAQGYTEIVGILLEKGANVNAAGGFYGSSLQIAATQGNTEIVSILLEKEIVGILLEKGANVNAARGFYGSSLQIAAARGHTEIVGILLEKGANVNAARGFYGSSLQIAAARGHTEIVGILLEKGADVNVAGGFYGSSLQIAAARGHAEIVSILLEKGTNINAARGFYGSSLQIAAARGYIEIVGILLEKGADVNAAGGSILLEKGANINAAGGFYGSSLQIAVAQGHTEIVGILLEKGADVNVAGGEDGTVLEIATKHGHNKIVPMLLERGARTNGDEQWC